ncbi:hypothetical protein BSZ07_38075 [Streptomyces sp. M1013]|uniref:helix-turn-helix domain-containing protein n=1 Tax=Streptomyces sp. M1013 TaxID=549798 RepID=UPI000978FD1A|nr:helix-turn-helix domain-containing protein [Streptomyces sp. M1013]OMI84589.1 hypothetical protein BSZ07_38075 [Streptomyces sp. M1013]
MEALYTTETVPGHRGLAYWRETLSRTFPSVDVSASGSDWRGAVRVSQLGMAQAVTFEGGPMRLRQSGRPSSSPRAASVALVAPVEGTAVVDHGEGSALVAPRTTAFLDLTRPTCVEFPSAHHVKCLIVPQQMLGLAQDDLRRLTTAPIPSNTPPGSLLSTLLTEVVDTAPTLSPAIGEMFTRPVVDLVSILAEERLHQEADAAPDSVRALLSRIQEYIERHLGDPGLTPESIARAHRISVRYLHRLFETEDTTVSRWVQRRRLQACRRDLARRQTVGRTISSVARQRGFASAAHFSRAFRATYGMSPAEWRRFALHTPSAPVSSRPAMQYDAVTGLLPRSLDPRLAQQETGTEAA